MSVVTLSVNAERLQAVQAVLEKHGRTLLVVIGHVGADFADNQRGAALLLHLFPQLKEPMADVALFLNGPDTAVVISDRAVVDASSSGLRAVPSSAVASLGMGAVGRPLIVLRREADIQAGAFAKAVLAAATTSVDEPNVVSECLAIKDAAAIQNVRKSAALCNAVLAKFVVEQYTTELGKHADAATPEDAQALSITDADFAARIAEHIAHPNRLPGLEKMNDPAFGVGIPTLVRSGGAYDPSYIVKRTSSEATPHAPGTTVVSYGIKYTGYVCYLARTLIFEPRVDPLVVQAYDFVYQVVEAAIAQLVPGRTLKAVYDAALQHAQSLNPSLAAQLLPDFGFGIGLHYYDAKSTINAKNEATVVQKGMTFGVRCGIADIRTPDGRSLGHGVLIGDTAVVGDERAEVLTNKRRHVSETCFKAVAPRAAAAAAEPRDLSKITRAAKADPSTTAKKRGLTEDQRQTAQASIVAEKQQQWIASGGQRATEAEAEELKITELGRLAKGDLNPFAEGAAVAADALPAAMAQAVLTSGALVNREKEVLYLAVAGRVLGFAIATVNKVEVRSAGSSTHQLVVTFHSSQESNVAFRTNRNKTFVREIVVTSADGAKLSQAASNVRDVQLNIKQKDSQRKAMQGIIQQPKLTLASDPLLLPQVKCRPPPMAMKNGCEGDLQVHRNGFRFAYRGGEPVDIVVSNIRHLIFQPAQNDICTILHFALKNPMLIGKKKVDHVQFVVEVVETSEKLSSRRMTHDEELEIEDEEAERISKTNKQFGKFCQGVKEKLELVAEISLNDFQINGVTKSSVNRLRGSENCLWSINELPFFVLSTAEVEVVALERVLPGQKNFDAAFVHTDLKTVRSVTTIPMEELDLLKDYLVQAKCVYFESTLNLQWTVVLKTIRDDKEFEPWGEGGWISTIAGDDEDEEASGTDDDDSTYEESDEESDEDDDDSDSDWAEEVDSDDEDDSGSGSEDDESGSSAVSWDEAERRAEAEDRKKTTRDDWSEDDEDSDRPKKKARTESGRKPPVAAAPAKGLVKTPAPAGGMKMPPGGAPPRPGMPIQRPAPGVLPQRR